MGFRINTNIGAMYAHRNSTLNNVALDKSLNALSSGLRINKAADDAAGLAIADKLSAQSQGLGQAINNSNDMIGLVQTADGAIEELTTIAQRVRVLSVQGANDTQDATSRSHITKELTQLSAQFANIVASTSFNGQVLLSGGTSFEAQIGFGATANDHFTVSIDDLSAGLGASAITDDTTARTNITTMDTLLDTLDGARATLGSQQNRLESNIRNISTTQVNVAAAESQLRDVDFAQESANFAKRNILAQSGSYALSQANAIQQNVLRLLQ
ncbi:flagellin [Sulfurimonas sp.]|uniref:flagellin N-terminal helical domain-containing protein n=1 Tax=Sulfurimonas sp. TaxID=2022749 RepID=UPI003D0BE1E1